MKIFLKSEKTKLKRRNEKMFFEAKEYCGKRNIKVRERKENEKMTRIQKETQKKKLKRRNWKNFMK